MTPEILGGMYVAALAHVEVCDVLVSDGKIELSARYSPSVALDLAFAASSEEIIGCLGWAVPLCRRPPSGRSPRWSAVQWPTRGWGRIGQAGMN